MTFSARRIHFNGIVQGVGFRPFVFKLAQELHIHGWVNNSSHGVNIHAEGDDLERFYSRLLEEKPPLARIVSQEWEEVKPEDYTTFSIVHSEEGSGADVLISPDVATCPDCLQDMFTPGDRRYHYPFTNCTNCGPRYTIIKQVPYDRPYTTMAPFPMCADCSREYHDPEDRRFHAQPVACGECGPQVQLLDGEGNAYSGLGIDQLKTGHILAVKGLGGFHLVCDARNRDAVERLRARKERGAKPFALMTANLAKVREEMEVSAQEAKLLTDIAAPIVILERKTRSWHTLPPEIAPGLSTLGVMLPYTPLHHMLFQDGPDFLVVTSANLSGRPLIYENQEAIKGLAEIADYFLLHNRDIYHPCDDSVVQMIGGTPVFHRRARGYVPLPHFSTTKILSPILAVGGEMKNAFALADKDRIFLSQYIGDIENYENYRRFIQEVDSFQAVVNIVPEKVVHDAHPNYQTTRYALETPWPKAAVQHHHAHMVSVLAEHNYPGPALGVICDGTGYGSDGKIWGFEFLHGDAKGFKRLAHLQYLPLPGGDAGAKHPLRIAYAYCKTLLSPEEWQASQSLWQALPAGEQQILDRQLAGGFQIFSTSSAGRLFDAVSALTGICRQVTYEGQAPIELESAASSWRSREAGGESPAYPWEIVEEGETLILSAAPMMTAVVRAVLAHDPPGEIAYRFHLTVAEAIVGTAERLLTGNEPLVLSGGVFQNKMLSEMVLKLCSEKNIKTLRAQAFPPGDGGIGLGQILIGNEVLNSCV